jgi:hypothetical protein
MRKPIGWQNMNADQKITALKIDLDRLYDRVELQESALKHLIERIDQTFDKVDQNFQQFDHTIKQIAADVSELKKSLSRM